MNLSRALALSLIAAAWLCSGCSHSHSDSGSSNAATLTAAEAQRQQRLAKAAADGAAAGAALSRSIALNQSRYRSTPVDSVEAPPLASDATEQPQAEHKRPRMTEDGFRDLDWLDIIPKEDVAALEDPSNTTIVKHIGNKRSKQVGTFHVVPGIDGLKAQLSGYVVPLESDDAGNLTEFLFVPFYGACIHVPPPPPNQIIYAKLTHPMKPPEIWDPFWLKGVIRANAVTNKMAGAAYTMDDAALVPWNG